MHKDGPEIDLYPAVLRRYSVSAYHRLFEVPYGRRRIDMLFIPRRLSGSLLTIAVEAKAEDWRAALWQARFNLAIADCSFIALPLEVAPRAIRYRDNFVRCGVGLIAVDVDEGDAQVEIEAGSPNRRLDASRRREIARKILEKVRITV